MTVLHFDQVSLSVHGVPLFAPLNVSVAGGEILCVCGPSGSGKSSLLAYACGFLPRDMTATGKICVDDQDVTTLPASERRLGLMFQDALLFPHLSVADNIAFGLCAGGRRRERQRRVEQALASVGLTDFGARDPATLSGGQRARVALLRVLLAEPRALLLDEPFGALDAVTRMQVRDLVQREAAQRGLPTVLVTHDKDDVAQLGGRIIELGQAH